MIVFGDFPNIPNIKIEKKDARSLRESTFRFLEEAIYCGYFPPGLRLIESELANKLEISRTPIREAILQLETQGLIKIEPNRGAIVTRFSIEDIEQTYIIFAALAGIAAGISAEIIGESEIERMDALIVKMDNIQDDKKLWFGLNNEFHSIFLRPCKKKILLNSIRNYTRQVGRYWYLFLAHSKYAKALNEGHKSILDALRSRDPKMTREKVEDHINFLARIVVESLRSISPAELAYPNFLK